MSHGGKREGAGRPQGSVNRNRQKIVERLTELNYCPIEAMLDMLEEDELPLDLQLKIHEHLSNKVYAKRQPISSIGFDNENKLNESFF